MTIFTAMLGSPGSPDTYRVDSRMAEVAARLQTFTYDLDGNLLSDGIADYQWDAENRLIRMETTTMARSWNFPHRLLEFRYDYMGRRVQKRVVDLGQTPNVEISCRRFLYDGWNLIAEFNAPGAATCGALLRSYTWGLDIVNTMASAGGVGALLQIADHPSGKTYLPTYDGNGNIAALLNAASDSLAAAYEYSPFGEPLRAQTLDATVADNPFRFSTKWTDLETGLVYYGHRYYDPKNGRFINRDPIEETGGLNLYGFCRNNPVNRWDYLGMTDDPDEVSRKPEDEGGAAALTDATTNVPTPTVGNPTPDVDTTVDEDYGDDYGGFDPFGMTLVVDGVNMGQVSAAEATAFAVVEHQMAQAAAQAEAQANHAALNAGFQPALDNIASAASNQIVENLNAGIEAASAAMSASTVRTSEEALTVSSTFSLSGVGTGLGNLDITTTAAASAPSLPAVDGSAAASTAVAAASELPSVAAPNNAVISFYSGTTDSWNPVAPGGLSTPTLSERQDQQRTANSQFHDNASVATGIAVGSVAVAAIGAAGGGAAVAGAPLVAAAGKAAVSAGGVMVTAARIAFAGAAADFTIAASSPAGQTWIQRGIRFADATWGPPGFTTPSGFYGWAFNRFVQDPLTQALRPPSPPPASPPPKPR